MLSLLIYLTVWFASPVESTTQQTYIYVTKSDINYEENMNDAMIDFPIDLE